MNARTLRSLCALGLISLAAGCCCEPGPRRTACRDALSDGCRSGRPHGCRSGCRDGQRHGCRPPAASLAKGRLSGLGGVCMYGFPPYVPAPLGFMLPAEQFTLASASRHVEIHSVIERPQPPEKLPTAADDSAKPLQPVEPPRDAASDAVEDSATPESANPDAVAQPSLAPRTAPPADAGRRSDAPLPDAPLPDSAKQPVSVPAPQADNREEKPLPENPLREDDAPAKNHAEAKSKGVGVGENNTDHVPAPKPESRAGSGENPSDSSAKDGENESDATDDEWPDAPLPKNELPPLAPAN